MRDMKEWLPVGQAAERLGITESTVYRRAKRGAIGSRITGKVMEFSLEDEEPADGEREAELKAKDEVIATLRAQV